MARVRFTANLARHIEVAPSDSEGVTVAEALARVFEANPRLRSYILDEHGRLRRHVTVFVNGEPAADRARLSDRVGATDEIFVVQALSGG
jgi:sulfur carrier protein ThiS